MLQRLMSFICKRSNPIKYAKKIGVSIGVNCKLNGSPNWGTEPFLISIGDHTEISFDCVFLTHDGSTWVFRDKEPYKDVLRFGRIKVGNNCFIGARSILMPGITVGDNSIIGAGSLVTKNVPAGEVWGGTS